MQVKKFEAKSMQDALAMVKRDLGPEAIILAAKDNKGNFGLAGENSVEVTAAVSGHKLKEHQFAMSRLKDTDRSQLLNGSASHQKKFIEKSVSRYKPEPEPAVRSRRYINIDDEENTDTVAENFNDQPAQTSYVQQGNMARVKAAIKEKTQSFEEPEEKVPKATKSKMVSDAAQNALQAFSKDWAEEEKTTPVQNEITPASTQSNAEVEALKKQIDQLQKLIHSFRDVPQTFLPSHPGADLEIPYELSPAYESLVGRGIEKAHAGELVKACQNTLEKSKWKKRGVVDACIAKQVLEEVKVRKTLDNGIHVFVGTSGSGKTSSLIKLAARLVVSERKNVAIITTDTHKVGASEQLKVYAKILNVPFGIVRNKNDWDRVLKALVDVDCILVDTPGVALRSLEEIEMIKSSIPEVLNHHPQVHLVQSVTMKNADAKKYAEKFKVFNFEDILFTKLDESVQHGLIYNQFKHFAVPILGFGVGANIPEDYEFASSERIIDLLFNISRKKEI